MKMDAIESRIKYIMKRDINEILFRHDGSTETLATSLDES